jgi:transposase
MVPCYSLATYSLLERYLIATLVLASEALNRRISPATSSSRETPPPLARHRLLYKARARVEQAVGKLKRFKRIALRCEKTAQNYGSFVALALGFILIKSVHTA